jgi:hypothetical protein
MTKYKDPRGLSLTSPPELVQQWADEQDWPTFEHIATQADRHL